MDTKLDKYQYNENLTLSIPLLTCHRETLPFKKYGEHHGRGATEA